LAAGFDKNARAWPAAAALGFGHVEIGTVTLLRAAGQRPKPRLFRYPAEEAVINRMGFNNEGADAIAARLARQPGPGARRIPLGINLGKSKVAPIDQAVADYLGSFASLADYADYLVLNVIEPQHARPAQAAGRVRLRELLGAVSAANRGARRAARQGPQAAAVENRAGSQLGRQIDGVLGVIAEFGLDGIIATNTTLARPGCVCRGQRGGRAERRAGAPALDGDHQLHREGDAGPAADHRGGRDHGFCRERRREARCGGDAGAALQRIDLSRAVFRRGSWRWALADRQRT
jgi:dihydroorotate dehydrogenase